MEPLLRILLVSQSPDEALGIERALQRAGYAPHVERVESAHALQMAIVQGTWSVLLIAPQPPMAEEQIRQFLQQHWLSLPVIKFQPGETERLIAEITRLTVTSQTRQSLDEAKSRADDAYSRASEALIESEERYRALIESTFDLICELDAEGRCIYVSPNFCQRLGYTGSELLGIPIFERLHPGESDRVIAQFASLMTGRQDGSLEFRHAHNNGAWVWLEGSMRLLRTGEVKRVVLIARDITDRKRHEAELAALISLAKTVNAQRDLSAIARELYSHLKPLLPFDSVSVQLLSGSELSVVGSAGEILSDACSAAISREEKPDHVAWQALQRGSVWMVNRWNRLETRKATALMASTPGAQPAEDESNFLRAFIKVPLVANGEVIGLLNFDSSRPYVFTDEHAGLARMAGEQVSVSIRQVRLLEKTLQTENKYRALLQDVEAIVWEADPNSLRFTFVSPQAEAWLGFSLSDWQNLDFWSERIHPEDRERVLAARESSVRNGENYQLEYRVFTEKGQVLWLRDLASVETSDGASTHVRGLMIDISSHKQFESAILERNTILRAVQEAAADGICVMDNDEVPVSFNRRFVEMWTIPGEIMDDLRDKRQIMAYVASMVQDSGEFLKKISALHENPSAIAQDEVRLQDGRLFEIYSAPAMTEDEKSFGRVWSFRDATEREQYELQLTHQAFHDPLTGLPNRALFMDRLRHAIARSNRVARLTGVLFLDLDRFKVVNDSLGHPVGDELLQQVAKRIERSTRPNDTAARFGGDEFTVLVEDITGTGDTVQVAERILESLEAPFHLAGHEVHMTGSIGIALSVSADDSADDLLRKADVAMYWSKNKGSGRFEVFDTKMSTQALERLQLEIDLRQAIKRHQLRIRYQPLVHLETGRIVGAEALLRWDHPTRGLVNPAEFIPIAEETGMILPIGAWVMREACEQARRWQQEFPIDPPLKISINLSAKQLEQPDLPSVVEKILKESELAPYSLELEITESVVMENVQSNIDTLETLKKLGVKLAIDDFGTGYSSLSYLEHFPLDALKIDRAFVGQIGNPHNGKHGNCGSNGHNGNGNGKTHGGVAVDGYENDASDKSGQNALAGEGLAILKAVSTLGQTLGVSVTAEGIETAEQRAQLAALSCEIGQGYHFAEPLEPTAVDSLLRHNSRL